jgi:chemotaxis signal transduction protein
MPKAQQKFITMKIGNSLYAMPILIGTQFVACNYICPIPKSAPQIKGLFYYHGKIITIFDITKILNIKTTKPDNKCFMWYYQDDFYGIIAEIGKGIVSDKKVFNDKSKKIFKQYIKINNKKIYILEPEQILEKADIL